MTEAQSTRFEMRAPNDWLRGLDDWRRQQSDLPARAEAIRRLVQVGIFADRAREQIQFAIDEPDEAKRLTRLHMALGALKSGFAEAAAS